MTGKELQPLPPVVAALPSPREFGKMLRDYLDTELIRVREERGEVHAPEDTFALVRSLRKFREVTQEYANAWTSVGKVADQEVEQELSTAVGEQDGVPIAGLTVPDTDGTEIKITRVMPNSHHIDTSTVLDVVCAEVMEEMDVIQATAEYAVAMALNPDTADVSREHLETIIAGAMRVAIDRAIELGSYSAQVSKVRAFAKRLASAGHDYLAGVVTKAVVTTKGYTGVKIERAESKK